MQPSSPYCSKFQQVVTMERAVSMLAFGMVAAALVAVSACSDKASSVLEPQTTVAASEITLVSSDENNVVAMSEEEMVDSLYAVMVGWYEADGDEYDEAALLRMAQFQAKALLGTEIYLSEYEVPYLPSAANPQYQYLTLGTDKGKFYFLLPHCICGHVMYEERYFNDRNFEMLTCGCTESLLL